jgi:hypothetical protein
VYHESEWEKSVDGDRYQSNREAYRQQVLNGTPLGGGYYLKTFPVWFGRRGNYGVLLAQTTALAAVSRLRRDQEGADLAERQLQWVMGRNPFTQSTMWGEGYDFAQQYSVTSGDFVGSLPVGMLTRENRDLPYWPPQNSYVYKEVWVHSSARWLWIMEDSGWSAPRRPGLELRTASQSAPDGTVTLKLYVKGEGRHAFALRCDNLRVEDAEKTVTLKPGVEAEVAWTGRLEQTSSPWIAVVIPDGHVAARLEVKRR